MGKAMAPYGTAVLLTAPLLLGSAPPAAAGVIEFFTKDRDDWFAAVGEVSTIDFTGFPEGTLITDQYAHLGVLFTSGSDYVACCYPNGYPNDGAGLYGYEGIELVFETPQAWIAVDYGTFKISLFRDGELFYTSSYFSGFFGGLVSAVAFDTALIFRPTVPNVSIDDLHFGPPACFGDLDGDDTVGAADLWRLLTAWGTSPPGPPDLDGDGEVGTPDLLRLLGSWGPCSSLPDCNGNGVYDLIDIQTGASEDCNQNAIPDDCDISSGTSPDFNGNEIPDECELPLNDTCENPIEISDGATQILTFGATTDGPLATCGAGVVVFHNDIWFLYRATCTGTATLSLCNEAGFDSLLGLYFGHECPAPLNPLACSDNAPGCGQTSEISQLVVGGFPYLVRVGGRQGGGFGVLRVSCEPQP